MDSHNYIIPVNVEDLVEKMLDPNRSKTERENYKYRIEAIRDYCVGALASYDRQFAPKRTVR